jgi:fibronectin-binding autotransporter adhesin
MPSPSETKNIADANGLNNVTPGASTIVSSCVDGGNSFFHRAKVGVSGTLTMTHNGTVNGASGSALLGTLPAGYTWLMGGEGSLTITRAGTNATGIAQTAACVVAVGTTATGTDNATLLTTEANIIGSTAFTMASGTTQSTLIPAGTINGYNGGSAGTPIYLNAAIPAAGVTGNSALAVSGYVSVAYARPAGLS